MTILEAARIYVQAGFSVIPLQPKEKRPMLAWSEYQHRLASEAEICLWFGAGYRPLSTEEKDLWWRQAKYPSEPPSDQRLRQIFAAGNQNNIGIVTGEVSDLVVLDCDDAAALALAEERGIGDGPRSLTSRGVHVLFHYHPGIRNWQKRKDLPGMDLRGEGGFIVAPPSIHPDGPRYRWQNSAAPRPVCPEWLIPAPPAPVLLPPAKEPKREREVTTSLKLRRASKYLATIPGAVSGSGGHQQTWIAALKVVRGFALPMAVAVELLETEYNPRCDPPWTLKEIEHKVSDAAASSILPFGCLLDQQYDPISATPPLMEPPYEPPEPSYSSDSSAHAYATAEAEPTTDLDA